MKRITDEIPLAQRNKANRHFMRIIWLMLSEPKNKIQDKIAAIEDPEKDSPPAIMSLYSWWYLVFRTESLASILVQIANDSNFRTTDAGEMYGYLLANYLGGNSEIEFGPWDTSPGQGYDSGYCLECGKFSHYLVNGLCPDCQP